MKNIKKIVASAMVIGVLSTGGTVFAATTGTTPADIAASLTGKTVEEVTKERAAGKTYGTIAKEAGKFDEFKAQTLEQKKALLDEKVKNATLTQEKADEIYNMMKTNQANCDGTGSKGVGKENGAGFGQGSGNGMGSMQHKGNGTGQGMHKSN